MIGSCEPEEQEPCQPMLDSLHNSTRHGSVHYNSAWRIPSHRLDAVQAAGLGVVSLEEGDPTDDELRCQVSVLLCPPWLWISPDHGPGGTAGWEAGLDHGVSLAYCIAGDWSGKLLDFVRGDLFY